MTALAIRSWEGARGIFPGLVLCFLISTLVFLFRAWTSWAVLSPLMLGMVLGMLVRNTIGTPTFAHPGITFSMRRILRFAIILLGFQLTLTQVAAIGLSGVLILGASLVATFIFTIWIGRLLGISSDLSMLIAAGTSICGASAVVAANSVAETHDEDVAYAIACVTVFGSISMVTYPIFLHFLGLAPQTYGLWAGASIHEIAQVIGAAFQGGAQAGEFATIAKLVRVMMLAPLLLALAFIVSRFQRAERGAKTARVPVPWFVFGFIAIILLNSVISLPVEWKTQLNWITSFLLTVALTAMGLETDIRRLQAMGLRPFLLGGIATIFIAGLSFTLISLWG